MVIRAEQAKCYIRSKRFLPFLTFLCLLPGHSSPKMCGFLSVWRFLLSFVYRHPLLTRFMVSCHLAPPPASLVIPSYLLAETMCHQGNTLARVKEQESRQGCCAVQSQNCRDQRPGSSAGNFREVNTSEAISPGSGWNRYMGTQAIVIITVIHCRG